MATMPVKLDTEHVNTKIAFLCERANYNPSALADVAGVTRQTARTYMEDALPSAVALLKIAEHFDVALDWLLDNGSKYPFEQPLNVAQIVADERLVAEAASRYAATEARLLCIIEAAETVDWSAVAEELEGAGSIGAASQKTKQALDIAVSLFHIVRNTLDHFDSVKVARQQGRVDAAPGKGDHDRRQYFTNRIDDIYTQLTTNDVTRSALMSALQGYVWVMGDPDAAFGLAEEALAKAGIEIEGIDQRSYRKQTERSEAMEQAKASGVRARKHR